MEKNKWRHSLEILLVINACPLSRSQPFGTHPLKLGLVNFRLLTSSWLVFYSRLHLFMSRRRLPNVVHSLLPVVSGVKTSTSALSNKRKRFRTSIFSYLFLTRNECLSLVIRQLLSTLCIYSFINLFNFLWAVQLRYKISVSIVIMLLSIKQASWIFENAFDRV